ncbi:fluoride efflux transporter CrcB [Roseomonas nepalensis]|uniref:Fluoride-specific ion channel FluC n=1 Tax=Muricoccus nepalensis TaxID=1854500 RepID=A0A502G267_9PROT|nr:fluoride efflux transporter CrcB [Roseomonas nepalensis]TPG55875.1 fluoride efflux transporter CrcB [Roseomonas nepalensis]
MTGYLAVFLGAGIGGALRHAVNLLAARLLGTDFPYATLTVNVLGSLAMGVLIGWFTHRADPGQAWRLFLTTGMLGGFTTFSTFSLDVAVLHERGQTGTASFYALLSLLVSVAALFAGLAVVRALFRQA